MKLTTLLLVAVYMNVAATGFGQKVTISGKDLPLEKVFSVIKKQTDYVCFYGYDILKDAKKVSLDFKNVDVEEVLKAALWGQGLDFSITGKTITIMKKPAPIKASGPKKIIKAKGIVFNEIGLPLSGANVVIKESGKGVITNAKGEFEFQAISSSSVLLISFIGFSPQEVNVEEDVTMQIRLKTAKHDLDEVVVQAYGTTSQRLATGNIAVVNAEDIEKQPVMNPLMALQGRVAGLDIQQTSGYASGPLKVEIRGRGAVDPSMVSDPLYIVDGVPLSVVEVGGNSNYATGSSGFLQNPGLVGPAGGQSPLFSINPSDIESISVLKDADATSIYGSRGANGVIIITTKKGKVGKTKFDVHVDQGVNKVTRYWKMLNTPQYLQMRREAFRNDGIAPDAGNAPDLLTWDTTRYTDWQKALYGKAGMVTNAQASISGGDSYTTFRVAGGYNRSTEITSSSGSDNRASVSINLGHKSLDQRFSITVSAGYTYTESNLVTLPQFSTYAPNAPAMYDSLGKLDWKDWRPIGANPFANLLYPYSSKTNFLNSNFGLSYQLIKGLMISVNGGYNNAQANQYAATPIAAQDPLSQPTGSARFGNNSNKNWVVEPQVTYDAWLGKGKLNVLIGGSAQRTSSDGILIEGTGYTSDALLKTISNAPNQATKENFGEYRYASLFARVGYNWENKYIININARRDGSSNYGPDNQYGNFASIGAAWIFTEEHWFKNKLRFLSFGKLRGSYGIAGSDGGIPYGYITRWSSDDQQNYTGIRPIIPTQHANPNYRWQENKELEGSIDLGFFKDWVTIGIAYYRKRTGNQLLAYPTAYLTGFTSVIANLDALVQNAGWEFNIGGKGVHVHTKYFNWDWAPRLNFSINENKFLSFPGLGSSPFRNRGQLGQPLNSVYVLHYIGVDPQTGAYIYEDKNHDGVVNAQAGPRGDGYYKKITPSFTTGFGFDFDVKGIRLSLFFNVRKQTGFNAIAQGYSPGTINANQPVEVLNRWQKPGDIVSVGKFSTVHGADPYVNMASSDIGYTDASYIRLQNLSLSYTLPQSLTKNSGFKCTFYVHASNLLTFTKYKGIDPETQRFGGMPPAKTVVGGVSLSF